MNAKQFLTEKGVFNVDNEVITCMEDYATLRQQPVSGSLQDIHDIIDFLQWAFRKIDKGDTPEETVRMLLMHREQIDNIKF